MGRKVAIKLLHPLLAADPDVVTRFFNEARAINMIAHENIVEILDFGQTTGGQPYFIMELLEGEPLSEPIARGPMEAAQVALVADQICRALGAAHAKGIVHRDLKPENVQLVTKADGSLQVKILDFGVAKILASAEGLQSSKTRTGLLMGTPLYMSPEQCNGAEPDRPSGGHLRARRDAVRDAGGSPSVRWPTGSESCSPCTCSNPRRRSPTWRRPFHRTWRPPS